MVSHLQEEGTGQHDEHCGAAKGSRDEAAEPDCCTIPYKPADGLIPKPAQSYLQRREAGHTVQHMQRSPVINAQGKQLSRGERLKGEEAPQRSRGSGKPRSQKEHEQTPCSSRPGARDAVTKAAQEDLKGSEKEGKDKQKAELSPECPTAPSQCQSGLLWTALTLQDKVKRRSQQHHRRACSHQNLLKRTAQAQQDWLGCWSQCLHRRACSRQVGAAAGLPSIRGSRQRLSAPANEPCLRAQPEMLRSRALRQQSAPSTTRPAGQPSRRSMHARAARQVPGM